MGMRVFGIGWWELEEMSFMSKAFSGRTTACGRGLDEETDAMADTDRIGTPDTMSRGSWIDIRASGT